MCTATAALVLLACATSEAPHTRGADGVPSAGGARNHPSCLVVIERHNHKTGGTTMRDIFAHQQAAGRCFYWGYGPAPPYWDGLMQILENGGMPFAAPTGHSLKLCVELHFRVPYWADAIPRLAAIRDRAKAAGTCRIVLVARVREPLSFYLSFWRWTIMGKQLSYLECQKQRAAGRWREARMPRDVGCPRLPPTKLAEDRYGFSFLEWVSRQPNLQSRLLLDAGSSTCAEEPARSDPPALRLGQPRLPCAQQAAAFGAAQRDELFARLDALDVVGTVEAFDAHLLVLQNLTGWTTPDLAYVHQTPRYRFLPPQYAGAALATNHPLACANMSACVEAVRRAAPIDRELWERYGVGFEARAAAALGGDAAMRARLAELRAKRVALGALAVALNNASRVAKDARERAAVAPYTADLRQRVSQERFCHAAKLALGRDVAPLSEAPPLSALALGGAAAGGARDASPPDPIVLPPTLVAMAERAVRSVRAVGPTACMPVPAEIVRLSQANFLVQRPKARHLPILELRAPAATTVAAFARWAAAHAQLVRAAGLSLVPPAYARLGVARGARRAVPTGLA